MNLNFKTSRGGESRLNKFLVERQNLSQIEVDEIKSLHTLKDSLLDQIDETADCSILPLIEELEYKLQDAWKFPKDRSYHTGWRESNICSCPTMDNEELRGVGGNEGCYRIYNGNCPLHSVKV